MGMYDTFVGEIKCPYCGEMHKFYEQTKDYDCILENFSIGDQIDSSNSNYIFKFEWFCDYDINNTSFDVGIVIENGTIMRFLVGDDIDYYKKASDNYNYLGITLPKCVEEIRHVAGNIEYCKIEALLTATYRFLSDYENTR